MLLFEKFPRIAAAILWAASRDEAMLIEHLVNVGRRSAVERVAHCLLELRQRLQLVGLVSETEFQCPLTQMRWVSVRFTSIVSFGSCASRIC